MNIVNVEVKLMEILKNVLLKTFQEWMLILGEEIIRYFEEFYFILFYFLLKFV